MLTEKCLVQVRDSDMKMDCGCMLCNRHITQSNSDILSLCLTLNIYMFNTTRNCKYNDLLDFIELFLY